MSQNQYFGVVSVEVELKKKKVSAKYSKSNMNFSLKYSIAVTVHQISIISPQLTSPVWYQGFHPKQ